MIKPSISCWSFMIEGSVELQIRGGGNKLEWWLHRIFRCWMQQQDGMTKGTGWTVPESTWVCRLTWKLSAHPVASRWLRNSLCAHCPVTSPISGNCPALHRIWISWKLCPKDTGSTDSSCPAWPPIAALVLFRVDAFSKCLRWPQLKAQPMVPSGGKRKPISMLLKVVLLYLKHWDCKKVLAPAIFLHCIKPRQVFFGLSVFFFIFFLNWWFVVDSWERETVRIWSGFEPHSSVWKTSLWNGISVTVYLGCSRWWRTRSRCFVPTSFTSRKAYICPCW